MTVEQVMTRLVRLGRIQRVDGPRIITAGDPCTTQTTFLVTALSRRRFIRSEGGERILMTWKGHYLLG